MHHYPFHIGDYRAATAHLSNEHDLAYRRLLDMYYDTEAPIPLDTQWVARRLRLETEVVQFVLDDMFERTDDGWHNARCDDELSRYTAIVERNRANGKSGGRPRSARNRRAVSDPKPNGNPLGTQREPSVVLGSWFSEFWERYGKKVDKPAAERAFAKAKPDEATFAAILKAAAAYVEATPDKAFRRNPATWLNARGWEDEIVVSNGEKAKAPKEPEHPRGMPIPYDSPLTPCHCGMCEKARVNRREVG